MNLYAILALPICFLFFLFLLYNYLIPRENCRKKLLICFGIAFLLQFPIRYCLLTDTGRIAQYNVAKLLTILSVYEA